MRSEICSFIHVSLRVVGRKNDGAPDVCPKILWSDMVKGRNVKRTDKSERTNEIMSDAD